MPAMSPPNRAGSFLACSKLNFRLLMAPDRLGLLIVPTPKPSALSEQGLFSDKVLICARCGVFSRTMSTKPPYEQRVSHRIMLYAAQRHPHELNQYTIEDILREEMEPDSKWIRVEDRLPGTNEEVLIGIAGNPRSVAGYLNSELKWKRVIGNKLIKVTHWQPMPEGPTE